MTTDLCQFSPEGHKPVQSPQGMQCLRCGMMLTTPIATLPPERPDGDRIRALGGTGILTAHDLAALTEAKRAIYELMKDGEWHTAVEIRAATGGQSEALRRMRELRGVRRIKIEERSGRGRLWYYRMVFA